MKSVVLLSGGLDSAVALAIAKSQGDDVYALTIQYGQRHQDEIRCAERLARAFNVVSHHVVAIGMRIIGGSALTATISVPTERTDGIPTTYVPARNTIFLSYALGWAEVLEADRIIVGFNHDDRAGYPDCRLEYLIAYQTMANLATKRGVSGNPIKIEAPLLTMNKEQIITLGHQLGVDFSLTSSCYQPTHGIPCKLCDSCVIRKEGFMSAGLTDPLESL
jgi:7-cyano-7-deazaguanine synthase